MEQNAQRNKLPLLGMIVTTALVLGGLCALLWWSNHRWSVYARRAAAAAEQGDWSLAERWGHKAENAGAVDVLNEVATSYLRQNVEERNAEAQQTLEFLEKQLPDLKARLDSSLMNMNAYQNRVGSVDVAAETQIVLQKRMQLEQSILEIQQKKQEAIRLFHAQHPTVKTLEDQERTLRRELAATSRDVKDLPETQQEVLKLTSEVELNKVLYTNMLNSVQQLRLVSAGEVGSVRIVDFAEQTTRPVKPQKKLILAIFFFLGLLLGAAIVSLRDKLSGRVLDRWLWWNPTMWLWNLFAL